jgi:hemerythrin-like domain-containing protein
MKCTEFLIAEHKLLLKVADVLGAIATAAKRDGRWNEQDAETILAILRRFGDDCLQAKEESALFPIIFKAISDQADYRVVRHMIFQHDQDRSLLEGMEDALRRSNTAEFAEYALSFTNIIRNHIQFEDQILSEAVDGNVSKQDEACILAEFEIFDREFERRNKRKLMHELSLLEAKYSDQAA